MPTSNNTAVFQKSGDINTAYSLFFTYNYTGTESVSSYALPFTGFVFVPFLDDIEQILSRKRIVWDFGDGTKVETVTARHAYKSPGKYKVSCYLYDRSGESYFDSYSVNVNVYNFIEDKLTLSTSSNLLTASKFTSPITVERTNSLQTHVYEDHDLTITPYASGFQTETNFFDSNINNKHFSHLYPYSSFYIRETNSNGITEFVEISSFKTTNELLYCKLSGTDVVLCDPKDSGAIFCGTSGTAEVYFKSDLPIDQVNLLFGFEPNNIRQFANTTTVGISAQIQPNNDFKTLSITSNGLESEGIGDTVFNIDKNKFSNTPINFVVRAKDSDNFSNKSGPLLSNIDIQLTDGTQIYPITAAINNVGVETLSSGSFIKGSFVFNTNTVLRDVFLVAITQFNSSSNTFFISGSSKPFNIYPQDNIYNITKQKEDFDMAETFKSISFQPLFEDLRNLYDEFLTNIFGNINSDQTSIGKVTHEKISNFVDNNSIADYANVDRLISIFNQFNIENIQFNTLNYRYPAAIGRLVDLLSIKKSKLFGNKNTFNENFKNYGYVDSDIYGINLGPTIHIDQIITPGSSIVAFEKFSGQFNVLNTFLPGLTSYTISDYEPSWGWGLLLPADGYGNNIVNYYTFYEHISTIEGSVQNSVINFDDPNNTLSPNLTSYTEWSSRDGIIANILLYEFLLRLQLFNISIEGELIPAIEVKVPIWTQLNQNYNEWSTYFNYFANFNYIE